MRIYADGIVTNEYNEVLLIQRNDSRTWATPGGAIEVGESPPVATAREVEEETGLKVMPVRLVDMQFRPEAPSGELIFSFRCIQRGGQIASSAESLQVGFFPATRLPRPMLNVHRAILANSLMHQGGPPNWHTTRLPAGVRLAKRLLYGLWDWRDRRQGRPPFQPPPSWKVGAFCLICNPAGEVLWVRRGDRDIWNLPGGGPAGIEAPWHTAIRETREETGLEVQLKDCIGVYSRTPQAHVVFTFAAEVTGGALKLNPEATDFGYFAPGREPPNSLLAHVERVVDAQPPRDKTIFRDQPY